MSISEARSDTYVSQENHHALPSIARRHQAVRGDGQVWESYTFMQARTHVGRQRPCHRHMAGPCIRSPLTVCSREDSRELWEFGLRNAARADARITEY